MVNFVLKMANGEMSVFWLVIWCDGFLRYQIPHYWKIGRHCMLKQVASTMWPNVCGPLSSGIVHFKLPILRDESSLRWGFPSSALSIQDMNQCSKAALLKRNPPAVWCTCWVSHIFIKVLNIFFFRLWVFIHPDFILFCKGSCKSKITVLQADINTCGHKAPLYVEA